MKTKMFQHVVNRFAAFTDYHDRKVIWTYATAIVFHFCFRHSFIQKTVITEK